MPLHFLFLQGMPCAYFSRIAAGLAARGCRTTGITLCTGDRLFWRGAHTVNYRGRYEDWPAFIADFLRRNVVTDLVLLGEQRNYHRIAIAAAQAQGVRVSVTDFGYLRPDWITLERDGMSGTSRFPRYLEQILALAATVPPADFTRRYTDSGLRMALRDMLYSYSNVYLGWLYPHYQRSDRRPHPFLYTPASAIRMLGSRVHRRGVRRRIDALLASQARYFVFPLQLAHDFQIVSYSPFRHLRDAVRIVLQSFALRSPADTRLVVKLHPWDDGLNQWGRHVARFAEEFGVAGRVEYLDGGDLDALLRAARGMVTVNSTSGIRALQLGCPVKTLGQAIYEIPGITYQGELDRFWSDATPPDPAHVGALLNLMAASIQIRGVFFSEPGQSAAVAAAVERLCAGTVNQCCS